MALVSPRAAPDPAFRGGCFMGGGSRTSAEQFSTHSRPTPHCEGPNSDRNSLGMLERATGIEPATRSLGSYCSTTELHPQLKEFLAYRRNGFRRISA